MKFIGVMVDIKDTCSAEDAEKIITVQEIFNEAIFRGFLHPDQDGNIPLAEFEKFLATTRTSRDAS